MAEKKYMRSGKGREGNGTKLPYIVLAFFGLGFLSLLLVALFSLLLEGPLVGDCVAVVELNGEITTTSASASMFTEGSYGSYELSQKIKDLNGREEVGAVLLVVNSPGGSVVASDEVYRAVDSLEKPTVAYFREVAASGGYYVSVPSDYIISEPNAMTGSIGTVMYLTEFSELAKMAGIKDVVVKSGEMKDIGNPLRNLTEEEHDLLYDLVMESFQDFKSKITDQRGDKLKYPYFNEVLDGRVLSGRMALQAGLVDELGSRDDALLKAAELAGMEYESASDIEVCMVRTSPEPAGLFDMASFIDGISASGSTPSLEYR
ncbi:signal peptide peptidase SppA [Candidatus Micrarchaeota archaeon]|nr:signal peptide peptidase SppA [Candidatus Micrarchaeota archaeon]MBD3418191.1 signal peptide peptidase SppA [Candidatus Micrarchaeota archaeon]